MRNISNYLLFPGLTKETNEAILEKSFTVLGYILSSIAISVHVFVHFTTDLFKNFPGNLLVCNCILLFIQYVVSMVFLSLELVNNEISSIFKSNLGSYNYWITAYIWSVLTRIQFVMALDLWKCIHKSTTNSRLLSDESNKTKFLKYFLLCWFSPFVEWLALWFISVKIYAFINYTNQNDETNDIINLVFLTYYIIDFMIMLSNFILYIMCVRYIYYTRSSVKRVTQTSNFAFYFKICGRLFIMSEVNYTMLILANHFKMNVLRNIFYNFMAYHGTIVFSAIVFSKINTVNN